MPPIGVFARLDPTVRAALEQQAQREQRSLSNLVSVILTEYVKQQQKGA